MPGSAYARAITIDNTTPSSVELTDYQVKITLNTAVLVSGGKMRSDGNDILFADGNNVCPYWIEPGTINTSTRSEEHTSELQSH